MSQILDMHGQVLHVPGAAFSPEREFQPLDYVFHVHSHRGPNGEVHARDVFMVVDPHLVGIMPTAQGGTYVVYGIPGFERPNHPSAPHMLPDLDLSDSATNAVFESMDDANRQALLSGAVYPGLTYRLVTIHPKLFHLPSDQLTLLDRSITVVFDHSIASRELPEMPVFASVGSEVVPDPSTAGGPRHEVTSGAVSETLPEASPNVPIPSSNDTITPDQVQ